MSCLEDTLEAIVKDEDFYKSQFLDLEKGNATP